MTHYSEDCYPLKIRQIEICNPHELIALTKNFGAVCVLVLPSDQDLSINEFSESINQVSKSLDQNATLITVGEPIGLAHTHMNISRLTYQLWIAIKRKNIKHSVSRNSLPQNHFGALIHTGYKGTLKHTTTRIQYTFCPACDKTTKDYGGKKHTYNSYGTLISDIWRDIACDLEGDLTEVMQRFADLFGIETYKELSNRSLIS